MPQQKNYWLTYILLILLFSGALTHILHIGETLESPSIKALSAQAARIGTANPVRLLQENIKHPMGLFLIQIVIIFPAALLMGQLFIRFHQPSVVGEILAGIILGPSILGTLSPHLYDFVFPHNSLGTLRLMSHLGILIFMFLIGMEANISAYKKGVHRTLLVSHAGILLPFFLGASSALILYRTYAGQNTPFLSFALFMGISMSITAFPVLARIIHERGMGSSFVGLTALGAAAIDDVTAWTVLALVVTIIEATSALNAVYTIIFFGLFIWLMLYFIRPLLQNFFDDNTEPTRQKMSVILWMIFSCALFTEAVGIHSIFGAFVAGLIMPSGDKFRSFLSDKLEYFSSVFLLPLFFAVTGVRTHVELLNDFSSLSVLALILLLAISGKFGGTVFAGRLTGMSWRDCFSLGALMNARGLMELIVLNLGYEMGIFSDRIFAMLVLMALITTFMACPLLNIFYRKPPAAA